jgi:hypothetical protein
MIFPSALDKIFKTAMGRFEAFGSSVAVVWVGWLLGCTAGGF